MKNSVRVLAIILCLAGLAGCAVKTAKRPLTDRDGEAAQRSLAMSGKTADADGVWYTVYTEPSNYLAGTGLRKVVRAKSGERIELWWVVDWLNKGRVFPRWHYELRYFGPDRDCRTPDGFQVGECHFSGGCNSVRYRTSRMNEDGMPSEFLALHWDSWDYGNDGEEGYLDRIQHVYDVTRNRYVVTKGLYRYPQGCVPPVSSPPDVCDAREECKPPYQLLKEEILESRPLMPERI
ncbi:MAG: hypothetical protein GXY80_02665 [Syntrophorhabdus aromaticivorans]|uniref:DUF3304 domain-containing protein n=1 Tax=Syntrophorhabdus aromaticivorans TaxID=328301 RepID=A0A351U5R3_9BACT|nr:hypothetical protein [Syntrophorhabdus aromaticivorans]HBA55294.1 hypothetical protein [Syntrophorhabdus aromaticivorans]